jgi:hypothetical protein
MASERSGAQDLLADVVRCEDALWANDHPPQGIIGFRNSAVRAAVEGGWSREEIARAVHVKPQDVDRWASAASPV